MEKITSEVSVWPSDGYKFTLDQLAFDEVNKALGRYLRNAAFNSAEYSRGKIRHQPPYVMDNFSSVPPFSLAASNSFSGRFLDFEGKSIEEKFNHWEQNYMLSKDMDGPIKVYSFAEPFKVDIYCEDDIAVMHLPFTSRPIIPKEQLVSPLMPEKDYKNELEEMQKLAQKYEPEIPGGKNEECLKVKCIPAEIKDRAKSYRDGGPPYKVKETTDCPGDRLYLVFDMDLRSIWNLGYKEKEGAVLDFFDNITNALQDVRNYMK